MEQYEILSIDSEYNLYSDEIITDFNLEFLNLKIWTVLPSDDSFPIRTIQNIIKLS